MLVSPFVGMAGTPVKVFISARTVENDNESPTGSVAAYTIANTGKAFQSQSTGGGSDEISGEWMQPQSVSDAANYECFVSVDSGSLDGGTTGSWMACNSGPTWSIIRVTTGIKTATITISIRLIGTTVTLTSAQIILIAKVTP